MKQVKLCGRCADRMRDRHICRLVERRLNVKYDCDNCGRRSFIAFYEVEPMRKPPTMGRRKNDA